MKIAFIYDAIYPYVKGGVEKRIYELTRRLSKHYEIYIIGYRYWDNNSNTKRYGNVTYYGTAPPVQFYSGDRRSLGEAVYYAATMSKAIDAMVREGIDVVDVQNIPYLHYPILHLVKKLKMLGRVNLVLTWHEVWRDYWLEYLGKALGLTGYIIERLLAKLSENNIAVSKRTKLTLEALGARNIAVIQNGVDYQLIKNISPSKEHQSDVIYAGRLTYEKKVEMLVQAIDLLRRELNDIKCIIIGDGPKKPRLKRLIQELHLEENIELLDPVNSHERYISILKSSKVFVLPSTREGFSIVALEANAAGLPVITFSHPMNAANDLIIDGYNGYKMPLNVEELAKHIYIALNRYKVMRRYSSRIAACYDWNKISMKLEEYYIRLLEIV